MRKKLSIILSIIIIWNQFFIPFSYAQDADVTPTPDSQQTTVTPSPAPSPEETSAPTPTPSPTAAAQITTGDATSNAQSDNAVNNNSPAISPTATPANIDNEATVTGQTAAGSVSGQNTSTDIPGDSDINSGTASASTIGQNLINTNAVDASPSAEATQSAQENIDIDNSADLQASASAESVSGQNMSSDNGGASNITSGTSLSNTAQVNVINTNIVGTDFDFINQCTVSTPSGDINLNDLWNALVSQETAGSANLSSNNVTVNIINNTANVEVTAQATSISGQNTSSNNAGSSTITTGDSIALADIVNMINTNIIGSKLLFGMINIVGNYNGDIIVPNLDSFGQEMLQANASDSQNITLQNSARISSQVAAIADSGSNNQTDDGLLIVKTGQSTAIATAANYVNINLLLSNWYHLIVNNFGFWNGSILGWSDPATATDQTQPSANYDNPTATDSPNNTAPNNNSSSITNNASVKTNILAEAVSGQNTTSGNRNSAIITGSSIAYANLMNLVNTNIRGSNLFLPIINIFGSWNGNLVFAYPKLAIDITTDKQDVSYGDTLNYTVHYTNSGNEVAKNVRINVDLPAEAKILSFSGPNHSQSGNGPVFDIGDVASQSQGTFSFSVEIDETLSRAAGKNILADIWDTLVKPVSAAENVKELVSTANIITPDRQSDTSANSSSVVNYLVLTDSSSQNTSNDNNTSVPTGTAGLEVSSYNNAGDYVYPNDIVTFTVFIKNTGSGIGRNGVVLQTIQNGDATVNNNKLNVGDIAPGLMKKLVFGIRVPSSAPAGIYKSIISAQTTSDDGSTASSDQTVSQFSVKNRVLQIIPVVEAQENGKVLGAKTNKIIAGQKKKKTDYLPFALMISVSVLWFVENVRRRHLSTA